LKIPGNQAVSQRRKENIVIKKKWTKSFAQYSNVISRHNIAVVEIQCIAKVGAKHQSMNESINLM
jgi:hypothetical protein